jgi:two-component system response regulator FixJ
MTEDEPIVYVVDDDRDIRTSLSRALRMRDFTVETYDSAGAFLDAYDGTRTGCLILDYGMPGMSGLELQQHVNREGYPLAIIFVTGHGGVPESVQAMKGGAVDFLEKPFRQSILVERIGTARELAVRMKEAAGRERDIAARFDRLTAREREIVDRILQHPGEVSSKEIGRLLGISPRTVDHHRARILEKLEVRSVVELVDLANGSLKAR